MVHGDSANYNFKTNKNNKINKDQMTEDTETIVLNFELYEYTRGGIIMHTPHLNLAQIRRDLATDVFGIRCSENSEGLTQDIIKLELD